VFKLEGGFGGFDWSGNRMRREQDRGPLRRDGLNDRGGRDLRRFDLEDTQLRRHIGRDLVGVFTERALGEAGPSFSSGHQLTWKFDEVCRDLDRRSGLLKDGSLTKCNLLVERESFSLVRRFIGLVDQRTAGCGDIFVDRKSYIVIEPYGEARSGRLRDRLRSDRGSFGDGSGILRRKLRCRCRRRSRGSQGPLIELRQKLVLGVGYGLGTESGNLSRGFGFADSGLGLLGEKGAIAGGVGIALGNGGGDAGGTRLRWVGLGRRSERRPICWVRRARWAASR